MAKKKLPVGKKTAKKKRSVKKSSKAAVSARVSNAPSRKAPTKTGALPVLAPGDIISIRIRPRAYALAKVIYLSTVIKGMFAMRAYDAVFPDRSMPNCLPVRFLRRPSGRPHVFWTGRDFIKEGRWVIVGKDEMTEVDHNSCIYAIGGAVRLGDKFLRKPTPADFDKYPGREISPNNFVEMDLRKVFHE